MFEDLKNYLDGDEYVEEYNIISNGWWTLFTISTTDSSVIEYLKNNDFPIIYSDSIDGIVIVKF